MRITNANDLLKEEIKDIYDFEKRLVRAIPKMAKAAKSQELRDGLMEHLEVTRTQVQRIEQVFELLEMPAKSKTCAGMKGIIEEGDEMLGEDMQGPLRDAAIIGAARRVEHYEMAAYAAVQSLAEHLGNEDVVNLLQETFDEERDADEKLAALGTQILASSEESEEESAEPARGSRRKVAPKSRRAGGR